MRLLVVMQTLWRATPLLCALSTFATYTATDHTLTAAIAFTSLALFDLLQQPATNFPQVLTGVIDARMSIIIVTCVVYYCACPYALV
jgi:hypothetical protein